MKTDWKDDRLGYKVLRRVTTPQTDLAPLRRYSTANISDVMGKLLTMDAKVQAVTGVPAPILGYAITVQIHPGDNLMIFKAMELAMPGDVIVVSGQFDTQNAVLGGVMAEMAAAKGISAFVTDGTVRDIEELEASPVAVFAQAITPVAPVKGGALGQVNTEVSCGGIIVRPGDVIMGDRNGVVAIPASDLADIIILAEQRIEKERHWLNLRAGKRYPLYSSSHDELISNGCYIDPGCEAL